ncbi:hypothetical protein ACFLUR_01750 [Chloroflexota bacterium]
MKFEAFDIGIIVLVVGLVAVGLAGFKLRNKKIYRLSSKPFLGIGIIWVLFGLGYALWRGGNPFDIALFNLGLILAVAGSLQIVMKRYNKRGDK